MESTARRRRKFAQPADAVTTRQALVQKHVDWAQRRVAALLPKGPPDLGDQDEFVVDRLECAHFIKLDVSEGMWRAFSAA